MPPATGLINTCTSEVTALSFVIKGADQLAKLAKDLRTAGENDLAKELRQGLVEATAPAKDNMRAHLRSDLPQHGGFARKMAAVRFNVRTSSRNGVRLTASHRYQLKLIDQGIVRHPLFGDREHWYTTRFAPGVLTHAWERSAPEARTRVEAAAQRVANKIGR